jgi:steroid delta-isomerase-like uncharacterized protein
MFVDGMVLGDVEAAVSAYAPGFVYHHPAADEIPGPPAGVEGMTALMAGARAAFPDMRYTVESLVAEDDRVALLYSWTGTHSGSLAGMSATGRRVSATGAIFYRVAEGKIVEQWDLDDRTGVMQQLGLGPGVAQPA